MAGKLIGAGGILLVVVVAAGTAAYIAGAAPPFPGNAIAFNGLLAGCLLYALAFGRR
ncbi:MAG TPA: hypothetical protein VFU47_07455 [Armatimonadota bacterium]|jgi:hypothetical protein|nr:hypothetical protein [Armatimonadota bacterium]